MGRPRKRLPLLDQLTAGGNRRVFSRKPLNKHVIFDDETGDPLLELTLTNIGIGGLFVEGDIPMRVGSKTFLSFSLPTAPSPIRLVGEIVRVERDATAAHIKGMGVRFVEVPTDVRHAIEQWLTTP